MYLVLNCFVVGGVLRLSGLILNFLLLSDKYHNYSRLHQVLSLICHDFSCLNLVYKCVLIMCVYMCVVSVRLCVCVPVFAAIDEEDGQEWWDHGPGTQRGHGTSYGAPSCSCCCCCCPCNTVQRVSS